MPEAGKEVVRYLFEKVGFNRIAAKHDKNNPKSGRVMQKIGMTYDGILTKAAFCNQGVADKVCWALFPFDNLVVAEDILGGLFVYLNNGNIGYFAPDCLEFEDMEIHFNQFLYWCLHGDTDTFYMDYRWKTWQEDSSNLNCNEGVAFYPFLWTQEWIEKWSRRIVPINEIIGLEFDFLKQISEAKE